MRAVLGILLGVVCGGATAGLVMVAARALGKGSPFAASGLAEGIAGFLASWSMVSFGLVVSGFPFIVVALLLLWGASRFIPPSRGSITFCSAIFSMLLPGMLFPALVGAGPDWITVVAACVGGIAFAQPAWHWAYRAPMPDRPALRA